MFKLSALSPLQHLAKLAAMTAFVVASAAGPLQGFAQQNPIPDCEKRHQQCLQQLTRCDSPQSTSDQREACLQACSRPQAECLATRDRLTKSLEEIQRTGGPKPAQCPKGWRAEQSPKDPLGRYKCFAVDNADPRIPKGTTCPPGLTFESMIDAYACTVPR